MNHVHYPPVPYPASRAYLLLALLTGCEEEARPWSAPPADRRIDESRPFLPADGTPSLLGDAGFLEPEDGDAGAEPILPPMRPVGGLWARCHEGFAPGEDPGADVVRLATACGPSNGMQRQRGLLRGEVRPDEPAVFELEAERGHCYRIFAAADPSAGRLTLTVGTGAVLLASHSAPRWAILEPERPVCAVRSGPLLITLASEGRGRHALEIWSTAPGDR